MAGDREDIFLLLSLFSLSRLASHLFPPECWDYMCAATPSFSSSSFFFFFLSPFMVTDIESWKPYFDGIGIPCAPHKGPAFKLHSLIKEVFTLLLGNGGTQL